MLNLSSGHLLPRAQTRSAAPGAQPSAPGPTRGAPAPTAAAAARLVELDVAAALGRSGPARTAPAPANDGATRPPRPLAQLLQVLGQFASIAPPAGGSENSPEADRQGDPAHRESTPRPATLPPTQDTATQRAAFGPVAPPAAAIANVASPTVAPAGAPVEQSPRAELVPPSGGKPVRAGSDPLPVLPMALVGVSAAALVAVLLIGP